MSIFKNKSEKSAATDREKSYEYLSDNTSSQPDQSQHYIQSCDFGSVHRNPHPNNVLAIFGLDLDVNKDDLYRIYTRYGSTKCKVIKDKVVIY